MRWWEAISSPLMVGSLGSGRQQELPFFCLLGQVLQYLPQHRPVFGVQRQATAIRLCLMAATHTLLIDNKYLHLLDSLSKPMRDFFLASYQVQDLNTGTKSAEQTRLQNPGRQNQPEYRARGHGNKAANYICTSLSLYSEDLWLKRIKKEITTLWSTMMRIGITACFRRQGRIVRRTDIFHQNGARAHTDNFKRKPWVSILSRLKQTQIGCVTSFQQAAQVSGIAGIVGHEHFALTKRHCNTVPEYFSQWEYWATRARSSGQIW